MTPTHIMVGTDFSRGAEAALDAAVMLAERAGARVTLIHVHDPMVLLPAPGEGEKVSLDHLLHVEEDLRRTLERVRLDRLGSVKDAQVELVIRSSPSHAMAERAAELGVDLIVVATHGRTGLAHFFIGSVAERTVRLAPCPVLVVPVAD